ncbi:hypothetical protein HHK36_028501 [Tetracentron sinense]|uniref:Ubiquitin carboxyl-terminal hydrolase n=1 Tax=Tetracentron sinense TaxID=13715 RepID=A0A834YGG4_TETSI|nr:hypothetical protein HHK36_028501 [Tetracentron sinense]
MESEISKTLDDDPSPPPASSSSFETLDNSLPLEETVADLLPSMSPPPLLETLDGHSAFLSSSPSEDSQDDPPSPSSTLPSLTDIKPWFSSKTSSIWPSFEEPNSLFSPNSYGESKPSMIGAGLANLGNTCFLNAVLQCFTHTVPFVQGLRSSNHATPCDRGSEGFCVFCALRDHIELSLSSSGGIISPFKLVDNMSYLSSSFSRFEQEDAHEFLQCLLDRLDSSCLDSNSKDRCLSSQDDSFVKQIFGGRLRSQLRCCNCGHCSDTFEPLIDLSLEIEDVDTLPSALKSFTKVEKIEDPEAKFTCENCKEEVSVEKQLMLDQAPSVATFHLKRFKNDGSYVEKIDKYIKYPLELDLQPYTSSSQNNDVDLKYELYAVVVHNGLSSWSGHYVCFIRSSPDTWYRLDDSKVKRVGEEFVLSQEAYILFYARQGSPWFSSLMERQKLCVDSDSLNTSPKSVLDDMETMCTSFPRGGSICNSEVKETKDNVQRNCSLVSSGERTCSGDFKECRDDVDKICTPIPCRASTCSGQVNKPLNNVERFSTPSPLGASNCSQEVNKARNNVIIHPQTPEPRSPSPDIYSEEPPDLSYHIPRNHLRSENRVPCKRQLNKALEDSKRTEAFRLMRSMPNSRSIKLMAVMMGSHSEGSLNRKKRRVGRLEDDSSDREANRPSAYRKLSPRSVNHAVAAGDFV